MSTRTFTIWTATAVAAAALGYDAIRDNVLFLAVQASARKPHEVTARMTILVSALDAMLLAYRILSTAATAALTDKLEGRGMIRHVFFGV